MILFHPDPEPTGGDPPAKPELSTSAAEQVGALKAQLEIEKTARVEAEAAVGQVRQLFNSGASEADRAQALQQVMLTGGLSEQDVQTLMQEYTTPPPGAADDVPPDPNPVVPPAGAPTEDQQRLAALEQRFEDMSTQRTEATKAASKKMLQTAVSTAWAESPDAKQLTERLVKVKDEATATKIGDLLQKDILREALEGLYNRKAQVGSFNPDWIPEEVSKAAAATLEKAKVLGATENVGKAPGGLDETVLLTEIANREIKPPAFDPKLAPEDNAAAAENWTVKRLQQMAAKRATMAAGGESKA